MNMQRGSNTQIIENHNKKHKNTRNVVNSLTSSERLINKMQLSSEKLQSHIKELNEKGLKAKETSDYAEALIYFQECQRLLQMGADCGKSIDRQLILIVLSNQAFTYQKLNKLENAKKYLQAAIFNIKTFLGDINQLTLEEEIRRFSEGKISLQQQNNFIKSQSERIHTLIIRKKEMAVAQMQYAELLAEARQHELAAQTAEKSIQSILKYCLILKDFKALTKDRIDTDSKLIQKMLDFPQEFKKSTLESLSASIQQHLHKQRTFNYQTKDEREKEFFDKLKIQDFFIIKTKSFQGNKNSKNLYNLLDAQQIVSNHLMELTVVMAVACLHFISGAQLLENSRAKEAIERETLYILEDERVQQKQSELRNKKVQKHYLFSLMLMLQYLPPQSQLLAQIKQIYKQTFQQHYEMLWSKQSQNQEMEQLQMMDIGLSTQIKPKANHSTKKQIVNEISDKSKFTLQVPNTNDFFLFDMASIDSIQCVSANSSMIDLGKGPQTSNQQSKKEIEDQSYFKNPTKSTKYDPLFMGTWDLRQLQKLSKTKKIEQKFETTQKTCQKSVEKESKEVRTVEGNQQQQVFEIVIHKRQKKSQKAQQTKRVCDIQKNKGQKTEANSVYEQSVKSKNLSKKKNIKNPQVIKQKEKNNQNVSKQAKDEKKSPIKVKFNKAKSPVVEVQKKTKKPSKDVKLKTIKSKSNKKPVSKQVKSNSKSLNKKGVSPPKNIKIKNQLIYYNKK